MRTAASAARRVLAPLNAAAALLLLVAGGLVTSTASGLAVPDWPLSYGRWMPEMTGGVFYEHGHRLFASAVGLMILAMALLTQAEDPRPGVRRLAWGTGVLVAGQGLLGGLTVLYGLPTAVSAAHGVLGQTVFVLLVVMAELVSEPEPEPAAASARGVGVLAAWAFAALWLQLALGAVLRHGAPVFRWHLLGALLAGALALWAASRTLAERPEPRLRAPAAWLTGLLFVQVLLGGAAAALRLSPDPRSSHAMIAAATAHLAVGSFLLAACAVLALRALRGRAA